MQSSPNVPWQFLWKNPVLHKARPCSSTSSSIPSQDNEEVVLTATAAHLTAAEYASCLSLLKCVNPQPKDGGISIEDASGIESPNAGGGGVVHVQLRNKRDAIILQLIDATADIIQYELFLQWPSSASRGAANSSRILQDVAFCRVVPPTSSASNLRRRKKQTSPAFPDEKAQDVSDALDTLRLLSLGISSTEHKIETIRASSEVSNVRVQVPAQCSDIADVDFMTINSKNTRVSDVSVTVPGDDDELLLLCVIQNDGTLHWYNALELLLHDSKTSEENTVAENFASFFLGDLFPVVQHRILPLSKTLATLHLSLMKESMAEATNNKRRENHYRPPLLHLDLVDASIEPTSSTRRTHANRITCCVTTREYLVIGGCGKRRIAVRQEKRGASKTNSEISNAGWVTFVSLRPEHNFAQVKSMYLPFAPKSLDHVAWEGMDLLLATNASLIRGKDRVLAIRMDAGLNLIPCNAPSSTRLTQYSSFADMLEQTQSLPQTIVAVSSGIRIRRFEFLSVRMDLYYPQSFIGAFNPFDSTASATKEKTLLVEVSVSSQNSPPGIITVYNSSMLPAEKGIFVELQSFQPLEFGGDRHFVLPVKRLCGHVAMIKYSDELGGSVVSHFPSVPEGGNVVSKGLFSMNASGPQNPASLAGCVSGRGWTLLSVKANSQDVIASKENYKRIFFICWEGQKNKDFSFFQHMNVDWGKDGTSMSDTDVQYMCNILPEKMSGDKHPRKAKARSESSASDGFPSLPTDHSYISAQTRTSYSVSVRSKNAVGGDEEEDDDMDELHNAVSTLTASEQESSEQRGHALLSSVESWRSLDGMCSQEWNLQVAKEILHCGKNGLIVLSHRRASVDPSNNSRSDHGTQFDIILSWLCRDRRDFFMAAYIALLILEDADCARQLRSLNLKKHHILSNTDAPSSTEVTIHQHILDGIELPPWYGRDFLTRTRDGGIWLQSHAVKKMSRVADLALVCLVKGEQNMFPVLCTFLKQNLYYNANRACCVLMGIFLMQLHEYYRSKTGNSLIEESIGDVLWPVRALLCIAVARNCMHETLLLLDAAAPTELRGFTDEHLCTSLVRLIVEASSFAPPILLSLTRVAADGAQRRYWESVPHCQKLKLSLLHINGRYPMLFLREVRSFILDELHAAVNACANGVVDLERVPSEWIGSLCIACLSNSNCQWKNLLTSATSRATEGCSSSIEDKFGDHLSLYRYENDILKSSLLLSSFDLSNLDFDVTIPTLLILRYRGQKWDKDGVVSTQALLNHICKLAGGRQLSSRFAFQGSTVMKQCGEIGNVEAAANLIGGRGGFLLKCCHIIQMKFPEVNMDEAEYAILRGDGRCRFHDEYVSDNSAPLQLLDYHRRVLQLFDDYVLSVTKFGDFDPGSFSKRGLVDPVFASRICLRLWLILTAIGVDKTLDRPRNDPMATAWLADWLTYRLRTDDEATRNGLACAALCRAALWPAECDYDHEYLTGRAGTMVMAEELGFSTQFMLSLTQSCRGLVESLPASVVKKIFAGS